MKPPKKAAKRQPVRKAIKKKPAPQPKPIEEPEPPSQLIQETNDLAPLPEESGPYTHFRVAIGEDKTDIPVRALAVAKKMQSEVEILDGKGRVARVIKPGLRKLGTRERGEGKQARVIALLLRPEGATKAEISAITEWGFGERWIRRLAKSSGSQMVVVAQNHWQLVKHEG